MTISGISGPACREIRPLLGVYVVGAIDPAERSTVDAHLAECQACRDELAGLVPDDWMQWALFGLASGLSVMIFRRRIYGLLRRKLPDMKQGPVGESVVLPAPLPPGESCRLEYCGSSWNATNGGA